MRAGELRNPLTIQQPTRAADEYGIVGTTTWTNVAQVWAGVRPLRAVEKLRADQVGQETDFIVKCRYTANITADCRLLWPQRAGGNRTLYITGIIDVNGRQTELEIMCSERAEASNG